MALTSAAIWSPPAANSGSWFPKSFWVRSSMSGSSSGGTPKIDMMTRNGKSQPISRAKSRRGPRSIMRSTNWRASRRTSASAARRRFEGLNQSLVTSR